MAFPGDYNWKVDISSDSTKVSGSDSNFPYYFDLSNITSADFWNNVQSNGGDLRVSTDSAGSNQVPLEVVAIDTVAETGQIYFKDATTASTSDTYYLWWDDSTGTVSQPAVTGTYGRNNVWTEYQRVFHFEESSGSIIDSTGTANATNNGATYGVAGKIGDGLDFEATNSDYVNIGTSAFGVQNYTVECWFKIESFGEIGYLGGRMNNPDRGSIVRINTNGSIEISYYVSGSYNNTITSASTVTTGTDYFGSFTRATGDQEIWINGTSEASGTDSSTFDTSAVDAAIGAGFSSNVAQHSSFFDGVISEWRILHKATASTWRATQYNMQSNNATFWTVGTPESTGTDYTQTLTETVSMTDTANKQTSITYSESISLTQDLDQTDYTISGTVTLSGSPQSGVTVILINDTDNTYEADTTTDGSGNYSFNLLDVNDTYHVAVQYDNAGTKYNDESKPYITPVGTNNDLDGA